MVSDTEANTDNTVWEGYGPWAVGANAEGATYFHSSYVWAAFDRDEYSAWYGHAKGFIELEVPAPIAIDLLYPVPVVVHGYTIQIDQSRRGYMVSGLVCQGDPPTCHVCAQPDDLNCKPPHTPSTPPHPATCLFACSVAPAG